jgi:hypothetical protein
MNPSAVDLLKLRVSQRQLHAHFRLMVGVVGGMLDKSARTGC